MKHEDNLGNSGIISYGNIQRISAGTGVLHSEFNASNDEEVRFLQLWFTPNEKKLTPSYEDISYDLEQLENNLLPVISHTSFRRGGWNPSEFNPLFIKIRWKENIKLLTGRRQKDLHLYYRRGNFNQSGFHIKVPGCCPDH